VGQISTAKVGHFWVAKNRSLKKKYQPDELIELYCNFFKIDDDFITTKGKNSDNRSIIMELLYRYCDLTQPQIGEIVGGIDYSSVSYARKRLRLKLGEDVDLKKKFFKIDEYLSRLKI
jgi:chromosomal replication initiation ATPase DnaA